MESGRAVLHTLAASVNETQESRAKSRHQIFLKCFLFHLPPLSWHRHLFLGCSLQEKKFVGEPGGVDYDTPAEYSRGCFRRLPFNCSSCRLVPEWCVTERRPETRRQSDLPRFTQHARRSDTLCCPQIILSCRVFPTGLITYVTARSRKNKKRKPSVLPQRRGSVHYTLARRWDADLHR